MGHNVDPSLVRREANGTIDSAHGQYRFFLLVPQESGSDVSPPLLFTRLYSLQIDRPQSVGYIASIGLEAPDIVGKDELRSIAGIVVERGDLIPIHRFGQIGANETGTTGDGDTFLLARARSKLSSVTAIQKNRLAASGRYANK
jgi:hypothetical protein